MGHLIHPMKQSEIKQRVQELLKLEQEGKILKREKMPLPVQGELFMMDKDEPEEERYEVRTSFAEIEDEESAAPEAAPPAAPIPELPPDLVHRSPEKNSRGMNFDRCVRWLKLSGLVKELGQTLYMILKKIVEYDLWYQANRDEPFYFSEGAYGDPFSLIAEQGGVEREHLQKRALPALKNLGFLDYWTDKGQILFKLNWDALFGVYRKRAYGIPFKEDGLRNAPADGSFVLRPTPFHHLRIEKGKVVPWDGGLAPGPPANGDSKEILKTALRELSPPMDEKEIPFCLTRRGDAEAALKLLYEMSLEKRSRIRNEAAYVLEMIRRGPKTPQGFQSPQEVRNKEEEKAKFERFLRAFEKSKFRHFRPDNGAKREISASNDQGFFARDEDGRETFQFFEDWMDLKFFS
ncbi:MAG: hypothetical protein HYU64_17995 [Armatimonadetes bacterium]|nr:hypothetical protein [Armatimonadota bacterium]